MGTEWVRRAVLQGVSQGEQGVGSRLSAFGSVTPGGSQPWLTSGQSLQDGLSLEGDL